MRSTCPATETCTADLCCPTMKRALITGITGQDGSYLSELLLAKGYEVHGIVRRSSTVNTGRLDAPHLDGRSADAVYESDGGPHLHSGSLNEGLVLARIVHEIRPDEIYNLGAMSHVQ